MSSQFAPKRPGSHPMFADESDRGGRREQFSPVPTPGKHVREIEPPEREAIEKIVRVFGF